MEEVWKVILNTYGKYQVSNFGRIKTYNCNENNKNYGKIMSLNRYPNGYEYVQFYINGIKSVCLVHRLVALHFIKNELNLPVVNHKNSIRWDNHFENLEWATQSYNIIHGYINNPRDFVNYKRDKEHYYSVEVDMLSVDGVKLKTFGAISSAVKFLIEIGACNKKSAESSIRDVISGKQKTAYGYKWRKTNNEI